MHRKSISTRQRLTVIITATVLTIGAAIFATFQASSGLAHPDYSSRLASALRPVAASVSEAHAWHHPRAATSGFPTKFTSSYRVRPHDTLSSIARRQYGKASRWPALWWLNRNKIPNPNIIRTGMRLRLSSWHPKRAWLTSRALRAIPKPKPLHVALVAAHGHSSSSPSSPTPEAAPAPSGGGCGLSGTLSFSQLEALWECAGGPSGVAATAACIAEHESAGNQFATGPFGERGYWQINPVNGPVLSTYDPEGNAHAAVSMSNDGSNWSAWTTAPDCGV